MKNKIGEFSVTMYKAKDEAVNAGFHLRCEFGDATRAQKAAMHSHVLILLRRLEDMILADYNFMDDKERGVHMRKQAYEKRFLDIPNL